MISHVHLGTNAFDRALAFYSAVFAALGLELKFVERDRPWAGWMTPGQPRPLFVVGAPFDGQPASVGNGQMVALLAASRDMVDRCFDIAIANGATPEGAPGLRPDYHPNYYGGYFRDPDGNKLCICCHEPAAT